jgi:hypothetical protein
MGVVCRELDAAYNKLGDSGAHTLAHHLTLLAAQRQQQQPALMELCGGHKKRKDRAGEAKSACMLQRLDLSSNGIGPGRHKTAHTHIKGADTHAWEGVLRGLWGGMKEAWG